MQISGATFRYKAFEHGNVVVVTGEIDLATAPVLGESIAQFSDGDVIADIANVEFIDSSGLKVLVAAHRLCARRGARLTIRGASGMAMRVLEVTGLDEVLHVDGVDGVDGPTRSLSPSEAATSAGN